MPIYSYRCLNGHIYEEMHRIDERMNHGTCPECGSNDAELIIIGGKIVTGIGDNIVSRTTDSFRSNLKRIKNFHKGSTIDA